MYRQIASRSLLMQLIVEVVNINKNMAKIQRIYQSLQRVEVK